MSEGKIFEPTTLLWDRLEEAGLLADQYDGDGDWCGQMISAFATDQAVASLALRGQPFGFTREDVALVRRMAQDLSCALEFDLSDRHIQDAELLAERIEALLPPE